MNKKTVRKSIKITARARNDLMEIGRYTESKWGKKQRNYYLKQIDDAFNLIGGSPKIGKDRSFVLAGYRSFQQGSHVIYYRESENIEIIRVLHERMDVERHIRKA